jgi:DICT domain-containing protein
VLPGLADFPITGVAELTPSACAVLADEFDRFYARLSQSSMWIKLFTDSDASFSESRRAQMKSYLKRALAKPPEFDTL